MSSEPVIRVSNLSKSFPIYARPADRLKQFIFPRLRRLLGLAPKQYYKTFTALRDINFEIRRGETVGIIGRNGAGKSTLLQILCGTLNPSSGEVEVKGRVAALLELGAGFNGEYTGRENVYMNARILGLTDEEIDARFNDIVAFADIGEHLEQPVKTYSSGMYVRLAFAVIAHVSADVLIIDEALAVGDAFFTQKCMRFLHSFRENNTVLFVSHDTQSIRNLCSYALWLEKGEVIESGSAKNVSEKYLEAFFESQQGRSALTRQNTTKLSRKTDQIRIDGADQRRELINSSCLRNDITVFKFDTDAMQFGEGNAQIFDVFLSNEDGQAYSCVVGGELVVLTIRAKALNALHKPIIGFYVKNRYGIELFGDNTYITYHDKPLSCKAGEELVAHFDFRMPILAAGHYSIGVAIATGTQEIHTHQHWLHDAVVLKSEASSASTGMIGIPMREISLAIENEMA